MTHWIHDLWRLRESNEPAVLVTVASTKGSVPRGPGTKMIVTATRVAGTIGGGHLELQATTIARDQLTSHSSDDALRRFPLGASLGQCCGGLVNLLFEPVTADASWLEPSLLLFRDRVPFAIVSATQGGCNPVKAIVTADRVFDPSNMIDTSILNVVRERLVKRDRAYLMHADSRDNAAVFFVDPVFPCDFEIVLFGAGHVGRALVRVLADVDCEITWVDAREEEFPLDVPANVDIVCTDVLEAEVEAASPGSYFLVMTHSHAQDEALCERILRRNDFAYCGLIGSAAKRRQFEKRLEHRGVSRGRFDAVTCPIGIAGIPGKEPATIAIAVAAEILQARAERTTRVAAAHAPASARVG